MKKLIISSAATLALTLSFATAGHAHYVEKGETMYQIAKWNEMSLKDLIDLNPHIKNPSLIHAGDYIIVRSAKAPQHDLVDYARSLQEITAYKDGGNNFPYEVDSPTWIQGIYKKFGIELPKTGREQAVTGEFVNFYNLEVGDLMFFSTRKDKEVTHVGIYMGNNLWISNLNEKDDVEISNTWGRWAQDYFLWGTRFKI